MCLFGNEFEVNGEIVMFDLFHGKKLQTNHIFVSLHDFKIEEKEITQKR